MYFVLGGEFSTQNISRPCEYNSKKNAFLLFAIKFCVFVLYLYITHTYSVYDSYYLSPWSVVSECLLRLGELSQTELISSCICWWIFILFAWEKDFFEFKVILKHFISLYQVLVWHFILNCGVMPTIGLGTFLINFCVFSEYFHCAYLSDPLTQLRVKTNHLKLILSVAYKTLLPMSTPAPTLLPISQFFYVVYFTSYTEIFIPFLKQNSVAEINMNGIELQHCRFVYVSKYV